MRLRIQAHLQTALGDTAHFHRDLRLMERYEGYKQLCDRQGRPFRSFRAFCIAKRPYGLEYDPEEVRLIRDEKVTPEERAEAPQELLGDRGPATSEELSIVSLRNNRLAGETSDYLTARIARNGFKPGLLRGSRAQQAQRAGRG